MRRIAVDVGAARIGVAISEGSLVLPLEAVVAGPNSYDQLIEIANERVATAIYVGLPLSLSGAMTESSRVAIAFARELGSRQVIPVRLIDERLTTKSAQQRLHQAGKNSRTSKSLIDAQSAALILEFALQSERDGALAGKSVEDLDA